MKKEKLKIKINSDFETQIRTLKKIASNLENRGSKTLFVIEKGEKLAVFDMGISEDSIVDLILGIAKRYESEFTCALGILREFEDAMKNSNRVRLN